MGHFEIKIPAEHLLEPEFLPRSATRAGREAEARARSELAQALAQETGDRATRGGLNAACSW